MKTQNPSVWKEVKKTLFWPALFFGIGIWRLSATGNWFYLVNFGYIGSSIWIGDFLLVFFVWFIWKHPIERSEELIWLIIGNLFHYASAILLAAILKDNRAFCKYGCPIPSFQKLGAHFSLMRIQADKELCNECGACEKMCPMNIRLIEYIKQGKRISSTECILCQTCTRICPTQALNSTFKIDMGFKEFIHFK